MAWLNAPADNIARSKLATETSRRYQIPLMLFREATGKVLDDAAKLQVIGAGIYHISAGGWDSGTLKLWSDYADQNNSTLCQISTEFTLPPEWVEGSVAKLFTSARWDGLATPDSAKIDVQVYELSDAGAVGSDLNTVGEQDLTNTFTDEPADGWTLTSGGLLVGDRLRILIQTNITTPGPGADDGWAEIGNVEMQLSVKG